MFLLNTINQYELNYENVPNQSDFRAFLMIALFHKDFEKIREELAWFIRFDRKKGVVIAFRSMFWLGLALIISIQGAFIELGKPTSALNLSLGMLMMWLPMTVVTSC